MKIRKKTVPGKGGIAGRHLGHVKERERTGNSSRAKEIRHTRTDESAIVTSNNRRWAQSWCVLLVASLRTRGY